MAKAIGGGYKSRGYRNTAAVHETALEEDRCRTLGIRPTWEREFGYYKMRTEDFPRSVALNEENHRANVALAETYPLAAWEWAKGDDVFQRFMQRAANATKQRRRQSRTRPASAGFLLGRRPHGEVGIREIYFGVIRPRASPRQPKRCQKKGGEVPVLTSRKTSAARSW